MDDYDESESVSQRRVKLYRMRQGATRVISSILTTVGAMEAISEGTMVNGLFTVVAGLALEREVKDPGRTTSLFALSLLLPTLVSVFTNREKTIRSTMDAFVITMKAACSLMLLRLLFMGRRLRQLRDLQKPKELE